MTHADSGDGRRGGSQQGRPGPRKVALGARPLPAEGPGPRQSRSKRDLSYDGGGPRAPSASAPHPEEPVPEIRPFRALRFDRSVVGDPGLVVAPPYDVIGPDLRATLVARHPANVVRLDLPAEEPGDEPDDRYRRAARTLAAWRSDGTLRKDPHPSVYVYEQTYVVPGTDVGADPARVLRAPPARALRTGVRRPAARADAGRPQGGPLQAAPRDRRQHEPGRRAVRRRFRCDRASAWPSRRPARPISRSTDDDGVRHRLWAVPADGDGAPAEIAAALIAAAASGPGHHRRRAPSLRDGAAVPRRAADDAAPARRIRRSTTC